MNPPDQAALEALAEQLGPPDVAAHRLEVAVAGVVHHLLVARAGPGGATIVMALNAMLDNGDEVLPYVPKAQTSGNTNYYVDAVFTTNDSTPLSAGSQWPLPGSTSVTSPGLGDSASSSYRAPRVPKRPCRR